MGLEHARPAHIRVLGPDHPDTFHVRNNVAYWRAEAGDLAGAAASAKRLLGDVVRVFGADHALAHIVRANLEDWT
ncbi:hypothetical protein AOZ06_18475 [Kibdelosporangium phytohabitans]|uniref:Tetratricopeptide repeat protein n=1 Tax=Kibdelosporangium phytohabitans TaxID=860235 RepID=A0A0N7F3H4_9PSEU|nr:tetratricopeptide repeat protein [Kibdelosporangium phytohabitans]ALG08639.1 hypothetical protein AOZ06_18475 [Kibdelosporangium phytohabitans]